MKWIISANGNLYDHASAFQKWGFIDWSQKANFQNGDIIYIYCTKPYSKIMYKTQVIETNIDFENCQDDEEFWFDKSIYESSKSSKFVRIKLLEQVDNEKLSLKNLQLKGIKGNIQGPRKIDDLLADYIDQYFNDFSVEGFFCDVSNDSNIFEGHKITVQVNKYERSSIARGKCIEYNGCNCYICGMNFENVYGEVGRGFIHVHHKIPLHEIDAEYCVDYKNDLIPVCPNCHAMLHRKENGTYLSIDELQQRLKKE